MDAIILFMLSFFVGLLGFMLGGGFGTILAPILMIIGIEPRVAIFSVLVSQFFGEIMATFFHHRVKNVNFNHNSHETKQGLVLGLCGISGAFGALLAISLENNLLVLYNVILLVCLGIIMIFVRLPQRENHVSLKKAATIGAIASLNKALTGGNYGPTVLAGSAILGANIKKTIAVISLAESLACGFAIIGYFFGGIYVDAFLIVAMSAGTVLAAIPSVLFVKSTSTRTLKILVGIIMIALGVGLWIKYDFSML